MGACFLPGPGLEQTPVEEGRLAARPSEAGVTRSERRPTAKPFTLKTKARAEGPLLLSLLLGSLLPVPTSFHLFLLFLLLCFSEAPVNR